METREAVLRASEEFNRAILSSLTAHIAVLDPMGNIMVVNEAWERFAHNAAASSTTSVGTNYLEVCRRVHGPETEMARAAIYGIEAVSHGELPEYVLEYPCPTPTNDECWFILRVTPLTGSPGNVVVSHTEVTEIKRTQRLLNEAYDELEKRVQERTIALREANEQLRLEMIQNTTALDLIEQYADEIYDLYNKAPCGYHSLNRYGVFVQINETELSWLGYTRDEMIGRMKFTDVVTPDSLELFRTNFDVLLHGGAIGDLQYQMIRKDGTTFPVLLNATVVLDDGGSFVRTRATVFDLTKRVQAETAEREQRTLAESLRDATTVLSSTLNVEEVLDYILANVGRVVEHDFGNISLIEKAFLRVVRAHGYPTDNGNISNLIEPVCIKQWPILQQMIDTHRATFGDLDEKLELRLLPQFPSLRSFVSAPISLDGEVIGFLTLHSVESGYFTPTHAERLQIFANQAAIALRNAHLYAQAQTLAALEERQRLARDLHDAVSQTLWSASLIADVLPSIWERDAEHGQNKLQKLRQLQRDAHLEMRALLLELRPLDSDSNGIEEMLTRLSDTFAARTGFKIDLVINGKFSLPPNVQVSLYRIAQESLNNILRHAEATHIAVRLDHENGTVVLRVIDNGRGFSPDIPSSTHLGLSIMRERAAKIGALFEILSQIGHGTEIRVRWASTE